MTQEPLELHLSSGETQGAREEVRRNEGRGRARNERGLCLPTTKEAERSEG